MDDKGDGGNALSPDRAAHAPGDLARVAAGIFAGFNLLDIASGRPGVAIDSTAAGAFASTGCGALSRGGHTVAAAFLCEVAPFASRSRATRWPSITSRAD